MSHFKQLFGLSPNEIKETCIIAPFIPKKSLKLFEINELTKGQFYSSGNTDQWTLIKTGVGATFVGDAVLYLEETNVKCLFFIGACGIVDQQLSLGLGSLVSPSKCFALESFTQILKHEDRKIIESFPDESLASSLKLYHRDIKDTSCISFGSIKLENDYVQLFELLKVGVIDMECAAFYLAAQSIQRKAAALLYVTDILKDKPLFSHLTDRDSQKINEGQKLSVNVLKEFIAKSLKS